MDYITPVGQEALGEAAVYTDNNPADGTVGSTVSSKAIEIPQREIVNTIKAAGIVPSSTDNTQLSQAIAKIAKAQTPASATTTTAGVVKPDGTSIVVDTNGVISATAQSPSIATTSSTGVVKPDGSTITVTAAGTLSAVALSATRDDQATSYKSAGTATATGYAIADGTDLAAIFGKLDTINNATSGTGTVVTAAALSISGKQITLTTTKGTPGYCSYCSYCNYCSYCAYSNNN